jgi:hypothetical protein
MSGVKPSACERALKTASGTDYHGVDLPSLNGATTRHAGEAMQSKTGQTGKYGCKLCTML